MTDKMTINWPVAVKELIKRYIVLDNWKKRCIYNYTDKNAYTALDNKMIEVCIHNYTNNKGLYWIIKL